MSAYAMQRLGFRLPDFTRYSWVSERARDVWQPRVQQIVACWHELEWRSVAAGLRVCALKIISPGQLPELSQQLREHGLAVQLLDTTSPSTSPYATLHTAAQPSEPCQYRVAIGAEEHLARLKAAWDSADQRQVRELLGYPECCGAFFEDVWVNQRFIDTTWPMACNTPAKTILDERTYEVAGPAATNVLLRWLGVRAVPHLPCRFDCAATIEQGQRWCELGDQAGYVQELAWVAEMLAWPVEWSALHGIAEIKTPVVKIAAVSDATADKYIVRWAGSVYPAEGAQGLAFPYRAPIQLRVTDSRAFKRGLAHARGGDQRDD